MYIPMVVPEDFGGCRSHARPGSEQKAVASGGGREAGELSGVPRKALGSL